jgi:hypothetical protein
MSVSDLAIHIDTDQQPSAGIFSLPMEFSMKRLVASVLGVGTVAASLMARNEPIRQRANAQQTINRAQHPGHHDADSSARLDPVKALRFAPTPFGAHGLDRLSVEPRDSIHVMAGRYDGLIHTQHRCVSADTMTAYNDLQRQQLAASEPAADEHGDHGVVPECA